MIKYNNSNINDWNFGEDNIIKVYRNNAVCYYKVTSGDTPTPVQEPCFAVVDNISQYSETEFEDVFNLADEKWYKLNNLNQYEQYGIYGSGRTITTYDGKLTVDEEASPSRLPDGYTEVEYIENTSTSYINTDLQIYSSTTNSFEVEAKLIAAKHDSQTYQNVFSCMSEDGEPYQGFTYRYQSSSLVGTSIPNGQNTFTIVNNEDSTQTVTVTSSSSQRTYTHTYPLTLFCGLNSSRSPFRWTNSKFYYCKIKINDELVRDLVPCKRDSDNKYGMYDIVNDVFYVSPNNVDFSGGEPVIQPTKTYEYMYSGGSWVNVGEVSGSTITIKSPEYIEKDSSHNGNINLDYVWKTNTKMQFKFYSTNNGGGQMIGEDEMPDNNDCRMFFASTTAYFDWGSSRISWSSNGRTNTLYEYEYGNYYIKNMVTSASKTGSTISTSRTNTLYFGLGDTDWFRTYYLKFYDGDTLVKDFIPWTDMNGNYGLFDKVSLSVYNVASGTLTGSSNVTDVEVGGGYEYPLEYVVREDPPNNLVFTSMEEAEEYECPWVGMKATIDGSGYTFSGDSISGYEWVYTPKTLPTGYTAVEYIQNASTAYINTNYYPNQDTRIVADMQVVTYNTYGRLFGAGNHNTANTISCDYNDSGSIFEVSWGGYTGWTQYSVTSNYDKHTYDWNKNSFYIDGTLLDTKTFKSFTCSYKLGIFNVLESGDVPASNTGRYFYGKLYSFKIYDNDTLVRDFVPCKRDSDSKYGLYDVVNDVFYISPNNTNFSGGSLV